MDLSQLVEFNDFNEFYGTFHHKSSIYRLSLKVPGFPSMKNANVLILKDLCDFAVAYNEDVDDIYEFFRKFDLAVSSYHEDKSILDSIILQRKREDMTRNILHIGSLRLHGNTHIRQKTRDLEVAVSDHSLPVCKEQWFPSTTGTIESYVNDFSRYIEDLDEFFDNINTIDELCYIVDPVHPSTKCNWRIFKIDQKCFVKVVIGPLLPSSITVAFIGPTLQVEKFRNKYEEEVSKWDYDLDVHKNLLKICGLVYFPMRDDEDEKESLSCSICGLFRLNDSIPMISCMISYLVYHVDCLKQWWSMFTETKTFL